jgi:hypothetical protein
LNLPLPEADLKKFLAMNMILTDLEHYLNTEIREWTNLARATTDNDKGASTVMNALLDIRKELNRLKEVYLTKI